MLSIDGETYFNLEVLQSERPVVVFFTATWCQPCHKLKVPLISLEETYKGQIKFYTIDIDNQQEITKSQNVTNIPMVIIYKNGVVTEKIASTDLNNMRNTIAKYI